MLYENGSETCRLSPEYGIYGSNHFSIECPIEIEDNITPKCAGCGLDNLSIYRVCGKKSASNKDANSKPKT